MFRLTRNLIKIKFKRSILVRFASNIQTNDQTVKSDLKIENDLNNDDHLLMDNEIDGFSDNLSKLKSREELTKFKEDLKKLTLAECLEKYECSIPDALQLDPKLEKRILIKGNVVFRINRTDKMILKVLDPDTFEMITVFVPEHVYKNQPDVGKGNSIVCTGLVFKNLITKKNSFYCDKIVYSNKISLHYIKNLYNSDNNIMDWFRLRNYPSMKFRSNKLAALIKLRSSLINQIHKTMNEEQFIHVTPPILTSWPVSTESSFTLRNNNIDDYFYTDVYLNKESDKHLESIVNAIPQIYTITHSFDSDQTRSKQVANETLSLEICQSTDDSIDDLMNQVEYFVKKLSTNYSSLKLNALNQLRDEKHKYDYKLDKVDFNYFRLTYEEALEVLKRKETLLEYGEQIKFHHKKLISEYFENYPIFIYNFPYEFKNDFDILCINDKSQRFELIIGHGLTVGKGKIKTRSSYNELSEKLKELNYDVNQANINWYLDLRKKGSVPCTWFSLSIDRYLMTIIDLPSLRDAILFPRMPNYCEL